MASGSLAYAQIASTPSASDVSVYNAGATDIPAFTLAILDGSNIMETTDLALNTINVVIATGTHNLFGFVTKEIIPAKKTGRCFGVGAIGVGIAYGTVTQGARIGSSDSTAGSLEAATAAGNYLGFALATCATTEQFPFLYVPGSGA